MTVKTTSSFELSVTADLCAKLQTRLQEADMSERQRRRLDGVRYISDTSGYDILSWAHKTLGDKMGLRGAVYIDGKSIGTVAIKSLNKGAVLVDSGDQPYQFQYVIAEHLYQHLATYSGVVFGMGYVDDHQHAYTEALKGSIKEGLEKIKARVLNGPSKFERGDVVEHLFDSTRKMVVVNSKVPVFGQRDELGCLAILVGAGADELGDMVAYTVGGTTEIDVNQYRLVE